MIEQNIVVDVKVHFPPESPFGEVATLRFQFLPRVGELLKIRLPGGQDHYVARVVDVGHKACNPDIAAACFIEVEPAEGGERERCERF